SIIRCIPSAHLQIRFNYTLHSISTFTNPFHHPLHSISTFTNPLQSSASIIRCIPSAHQHISTLAHHSYIPSITLLYFRSISFLLRLSFGVSSPLSTPHSCGSSANFFTCSTGLKRGL